MINRFCSFAIIWLIWSHFHPLKSLPHVIYVLFSYYYYYLLFYRFQTANKFNCEDFQKLFILFYFPIVLFLYIIRPESMLSISKKKEDENRPFFCFLFLLYLHTTMCLYKYESWKIIEQNDFFIAVQWMHVHILQ